MDFLNIIVAVDLTGREWHTKEQARSVANDGYVAVRMTRGVL